MANWVALNGYAKGQFTDTTGVVQPGRSVNIYLRGTTTPPVGGIAPNSDGSGTPLTQPLVADSNGDVPGYILGQQAIDFYDPVTTNRKQAEAISARDVGNMAPAVGTHAARPVASAANDGLIYFETDTGLTFISDGTNWNNISRGEILYSELTSGFTTTVTSAWVDVPGLSATVKVGVRPIKVIFDAYGITHSATAAPLIAITEGTTQLVAAQASVPAGGFIPIHREARLMPTAGNHSYKAQIFCSTGGTFGLNAFAGSVVASLQVIEV